MAAKDKPPPSVRKCHTQMVKELDELFPDTKKPWKKLCCHVQTEGLLSDSDLGEVKHMFQLFIKLMEKGQIQYGEYEPICDILKCYKTDAEKIIKRYTRLIKEASSETGERDDSTDSNSDTEPKKRKSKRKKDAADRDTDDMPRNKMWRKFLENIHAEAENFLEVFQEKTGCISSLELDLRYANAEFTAQNDIRNSEALRHSLNTQIKENIGENERNVNLKLIKKCIIVSFDITGATHPLHPSALALAERFSTGLKDSSILLTDEIGNPLQIQQDSIKFTMKETVNAADIVNSPMVSIDQAAYCVVTGDNAILTSRLLTSTPITSVTWFRINNDDGTVHAIEINKEKYSGGSVESPSLVIGDTTLEDEGRYVCHAENRFGVGKSFSTFLCIFNSDNLETFSATLKAETLHRNSQTSSSSKATSDEGSTMQPITEKDSPVPFQGLAAEDKPTKGVLKIDSKIVEELGKRKHAHESDSETEAREGNSRRRKRKGKISRDSDSMTENEGRESPQRKDNLETFLALQPETLQRTSQESHVSRFDMATDFTRPQEALDLHTEMVQKLGELFPVNGTKWQIIMNRLQMCNLLPVVDADGFKTMNDLFKRLVQKKDNGITYGEYTRIRTILGSCNTFAEEIIDHYTGRIHAFYKGKRKHTHESDSETEAREGNSRRRKRKGKISRDSDSETENEGRESPQRKGKRKHAHESDSETEAREGNSRRRKRKGKISRDSDSETENEGRESPQRKDNLETFLALQPETLQRTSQESHEKVITSAAAGGHADTDKVLLEKGREPYDVTFRGLAAEDKPPSEVLEIHSKMMEKLGKRKLSDSDTGNEGRTSPQRKDVVPSLIINNKFFSVTKGKTVLLKCAISSTTVIRNVQWKRKRKGEATFRDIKIDNQNYFGGFVNSPSLSIDKTKENDNGAKYICLATNDAGTGQSDEIHIKVTQTETDAAAKDPGKMTLGEMSEKDTEKAKFQIQQLAGTSGKLIGITLTSGLDTRAINVQFIVQKYVRIHKKKLQKNIASLLGVHRRIVNIQLITGCIIVSLDITGATQPFDASALALAERFIAGLKDGSSLPTDETGTPLQIQQASIKIKMKETPETAVNENLPKVSIDQASFCVVTGEIVILKSRLLKSTPSTSITWFRINNDDNTEHAIDIDNKKYFGGAIESPSLVIDDTTVEDTGRYVCHAKNRFGVGKSFTTTLLVSNSDNIETGFEALQAETSLNDSQSEGSSETTSDDDSVTQKLESPFLASAAAVAHTDTEKLLLEKGRELYEVPFQGLAAEDKPTKGVLKIDSKIVEELGKRKHTHEYDSETEATEGNSRRRENNLETFLALQPETLQRNSQESHNPEVDSELRNGKWKKGRPYQFRKQMDNTHDARIIDVWTRARNAVGRIRGPHYTGTGIRVGTKYILTAYHVAKDITKENKNDAEDWAKLGSNQVWIEFHFPNKTAGEKFYFEPERPVYDERLDFAILELQTGKSESPQPIKKFGKPDYSQCFALLGHSAKSNSKIMQFDSDIKLFDLDDKMKNSKRRKYMIENDTVKPGYGGIQDEGKVLFDCWVQHGASGSPGIVMGNDDEEPICTLMLVRGFPEQAFSEHVPHEEMIEQGVTMEAIAKAINRMGKNIKTLKVDIFGKSFS